MTVPSWLRLSNCTTAVSEQCKQGNFTSRNLLHFAQSPPPFHNELTPKLCVWSPHEYYMSCLSYPRWFNCILVTETFGVSSYHSHSSFINPYATWSYSAGQNNTQGILRLLSENIQNYNITCCCVWVWNFISRTLREEHRLRVSENRMLRRIFGPKRKWRKAGEDCIMRSFITCTLH
jgi:hypothetical protein